MVNIDDLRKEQTIVFKCAGRNAKGTIEAIAHNKKTIAVIRINNGEKHIITPEEILSVEV